MLNRGEFQEVEHIFAKCLPMTDNVELCRLYVSYVRRTNDIITGGEKARGIVVQAFEFAVNKVGIDIASADLWNDYLEFLKSWTPAASWEQQQKVDMIRKVYKRYLVIPTEKIEAAWSVYTKWENEINTSTASKFIAEKSSEFMEARSWNTEWHNVTENSLRRDIIPYGLLDKKNTVNNQLKFWYNWLSLEKQNKLNLKDESQVQKRIEYFFKQAVTSLPFVPELWFKYNVFVTHSGSDINFNRCIEVLNDGLTLNPKSFLLTFQLSEMYEQDGNVEKAKEVFHKLINVLTRDYDDIKEKVDKISDHTQPDNAGQSNGSSKTEDDIEVDKTDDNDENDDNNENDVNRSSHRLTDEQATQLVKLQNNLENLNKAITLVYTKLMMCCKRTDGIKEARKVFIQARNVDFKSIGYEFYVENALMEYHSDNLKTANRVFEVGMKHFKKDGNFLLAYLNFLIMTNRGENIKVLFEQGVGSLLQDLKKTEEEIDSAKGMGVSPVLERNLRENYESKKDQMKRFMKTFSRHQSVYGDLDLVKSLDRRYEEYFQVDDALELFSDRYRGPSIDVIYNYDLAMDNKKRKNGEANGHSKKRNIDTPVVEEAPIEKHADPTPVSQEPQAPKLQAQSQNFVGLTTYNLLRVLPNSSYFGPQSDHGFDSEKLVELFSNIPDIPTD